jgi:hypothetical protein
MSNNYGSHVSRVLSGSGHGFQAVVLGKRVPVIDADYNVSQDIQRERLDAIVGTMVPSGVLETKLNANAQDWVFGRDNVFTDMDTRGNQIAFPNFRTVVNNWVVDVVASRFGPAVLADMNYCTVELPTGPSVSQRQDLLFLEVFQVLVAPNPSTTNKPAADKIWPHGNVNYKGVTLNDDILDPTLNRLSTKRVQLQYRLRVHTGANLTNYPEGLGDPTIMAQGPGGSLSTYLYTSQGGGLYRAGDGSGTAQTDLGTVDGYVYAIPLMAIHRRNSTAYSITNPNGSSVSILDLATSDRPDGLFYDEVTRQDVTDLRRSVAMTGWDKQALLEGAFRDLIHGNLTTGWASDLTNSTYGSTSMLRVEDISVPDIIGSLTIGTPDGYRRSFSDAPSAQTHAKGIAQGTAVSTGPVQHNAGLNTITVEAQSGGTILDTPVMTWVSTGANNGQPVVIIGSWSVAGTTRTATLDPAGLGYVAGNTIAVEFVEEFDAGQGLGYVPTDVWQVYNAKIAAPTDWGFTLVGATSRTVPITSTSLVSGQPDTAVDYATDTMASDRGYSRLVTYNVAGNGTNTYVIPATLYGRDVIGLAKVEVSLALAAYAIVAPTTVTRTGISTLSVVMPASYSASDRLKFSVVVAQTDVRVDAPKKALAEITRTSLETFTITGPGSVAVVDFGVPLKSYASIELTTGVKTPYVFSDITNQLVPLVSIVITGSVMRMTFTGAAAGTYKMPIVKAYAPDTDDQVQVFYNHKPYQGVWKAGMLTGATVVALGQNSVMHTLGTKLEVPYLPAQMSTHLPLPAAKNDGDLDGQDLPTDYDAPLVETSPFINSNIHNGYGRPLKVGLALSEYTPVGPVTPPKRGASGKVVQVTEGAFTGTVEVETKLIGATRTYAGAHYALVKATGGELLMLVGTGIFTSTGLDRMAMDTGTGVAWDVFRLPGRPTEG